MIYFPPIPFLMATLTALLLSGCGGSSSTNTSIGDTGNIGDTENTGGGQPKAGSITLANYQSVLDAGFGGFGGLTESTDAFSESISDDSTDDIFDISACDTGTVTPSETLTSRSVVFTNCVVGASVFNGSISANVTGISGGFLLNPPAGDGSLTATISLADFTAKTSDIDLSGLDGTLSLKVTVAGADETTEISTSDLSLNVTKGGASQVFAFKSMAIKFLEEGSTLEDVDTLDFSYTQLLDDELVTITYDTTIPFRFSENESNPYAGSMTITSSAGGTIRITANSDQPDTALLEVDVDDDGANELNAGKQPWASISG